MRRRIVVSLLLPFLAFFATFVLIAALHVASGGSFGGGGTSVLLMGGLAGLMTGGGVALVLGLDMARRLTEIGEDVRAMTRARETHAADADEIDELEIGISSLTRQFERQLADAEAERAKLEAILRSVADGVLVVDGGGHVVLANPAAVALLEIPTSDEFEGARFNRLCRNPDLVAMVDAVVRDRAQLSQGEVVFEGEERRILSVTATPVESSEERIGAVFLLRDVTRIRQLETVRSDFVANVSHELRTPLTSIRGYAESLLDGALEDPERSRRFLGIIERHAMRLARLIEDLLSLSDLELGRTPIEASPLELGAVVESVHELLGPEAERRQVTLEASVPESLPLVVADRDRVEQVLINLLDNAIKYSPSGATVRTELHTNGAGVEMRVVDRGAGIPDKHLARLTERFYRVDRARSRELGGTGLGLAIVRHIVQAHGGTLRFESEVNRGTTARVTWPGAAALGG